MNVTQLERDFLKRLGQFACSVNTFTASTKYYAGYNPDLAQATLDSLADKGLVLEIKSGYKLSAKGRQYLDAPG